MKKHVQIRIIGNHPAKGQQDLPKELIGMIYDAELGFHNDDSRRPDGTCSIICELHPFNGQIVLQPIEFVIQQRINVSNL